jgi:hypothetical protein
LAQNDAILSVPENQVSKQKNSQEKVTLLQQVIIFNSVLARDILNLRGRFFHRFKKIVTTNSAVSIRVCHATQPPCLPEPRRSGPARGSCFAPQGRVENAG